MAAVFSTSEYEGYEFTTGMILQVGCFFLLRHDQIPSAGEKNHSCHEKTARTVAAVSMAGLSQGKIYRWDCEMTPTDNITTAIGFQERIHETMCLETTHFSKVFFYLCFLKFEYEITNKTPGWILETVAIFRSAIQDGKIWMFQLPFLGHVQHWGPQEIFHVLN